MQIILDDFSWQRPVSRRKGFAWQGSGADMHLVPIEGVAFQAYQPHAGLFRDFADLEPTPAAILKFANRYGLLRESPEPISSWKHDIEHFQELVALVDAVATDDIKKIARALEPFLVSSLASAADIRPILQKRKRGQKVSANELAHAAVTRLYHAIAPHERLAAAGSWNAREGRVELRIKAGDLLDFLFVQLGEAVIRGHHFRKCIVCGKWLLLTPEANRADRTTCSGYCRLQRYRQRRAVAVALHEKDWTAQEIAKRLGSDPSRIKRWVLEAKEG